MNCTVRSLQSFRRVPALVRQCHALSNVRIRSPLAPHNCSRITFMPRAFSRPHWRGLATLSDDEIRRKMDDFNDLFITAREEIEFAGESRETTYFNEEAEAAKEAVEEAVAVFEGLLKEVDEDKRREIMRGSGLKVEQLKAELDQLLESDDH